MAGQPDGNLRCIHVEIKMKKKPMEEPEFGDIMAFFTPLVQLSGIGIQNKMKPKEVVDYFLDVMEEFMQKIGEGGLP